MSFELEASSITVDDREWPLVDAADGDVTDDTADSVLAVPAEEQVTVPVTVSNEGDAERAADVALQANGDTVAHERGSVPAGETITERLTWTPKTPGEYTVRVGDETLTVVVRAPSSVAVTDLSLEPETLEADEPVTATATVDATDDRPGAALLPFRTTSGTEYVPAVVPAGDTTTVSHEHTFAEDGQYEVAAGEESATVTVGHNPPAELESVPGFSAPIAIVAGALAALVLYLRQPDRH
nr:CARDB domain-containing protein [Natronolimnobius sp. AArcel1]